MSTKKKDKKICRAFPSGVQVLCGKAPPSAKIVYHVLWSDGTTTIRYGRSVNTVPGYEHINGTKKQRERTRRNLRPDLFHSLLAIETLLQPVREACAVLDKEWLPAEDE